MHAEAILPHIAGLDLESDPDRLSIRPDTAELVDHGGLGGKQPIDHCVGLAQIVGVDIAGESSVPLAQDLGRLPGDLLQSRRHEGTEDVSAGGHPEAEHAHGQGPDQTFVLAPRFLELAADHATFGDVPDDATGQVGAVWRDPCLELQVPSIDVEGVLDRLHPLGIDGLTDALEHAFGQVLRQDIMDVLAEEVVRRSHEELGARRGVVDDVPVVVLHKKEVGNGLKEHFVAEPTGHQFRFELLLFGDVEMGADHAQGSTIVVSIHNPSSSQHPAPSSCGGAETDLLMVLRASARNVAVVRLPDARQVLWMDQREPCVELSRLRELPLRISQPSEPPLRQIGGRRFEGRSPKRHRLSPQEMPGRFLPLARYPWKWPSLRFLIDHKPSSPGTPALGAQRQWRLLPFAAFRKSPDAATVPSGQRPRHASPAWRRVRLTRGGIWA